MSWFRVSIVFILGTTLLLSSGLSREYFNQSALTFLPFQHGFSLSLSQENLRSHFNPFMFLELAGVALFDYDADGDLDIYLTNGPDHANALLENDQGVFIDVAAQAGVDHLGSTGVVSGDIDNDGDEDLFLASIEGNVLYANNADGTFTNITRQAGVSAAKQLSLSATFCDFDNDGYLDLYVSSFRQFDTDEAHHNLLYHNNKDLTFTEISHAAGVANPVTRTLNTRTQNASWAVACLDYDNDGDQDLIVAVDFATVTLFHNQWQETATLTFRNVTLEAGLSTVGNWMGFAVADFNGDAYLDIFATNWGISKPLYQQDPPVETLSHALYINNKNGTFTDMADEVGVGAWQFGWGAVPLDWDNDGTMDLYYAGNFFTNLPGPIQDNPGHLFLNNGQAHFTEAGDAYGLVNVDAQGLNQIAHGVVAGDLDGDGFFDLVVANAARVDLSQLRVNPGVPRYFHNNHSSRDPFANWLRINTIGIQSNRNGIGAKVFVFSDQRRQMQQVSSGAGHLGQSSLALGFGLGNSTRAERIEVHWPSGQIDVLTEIAANQVITITEGKGLSR